MGIPSDAICFIQKPSTENLFICVKSAAAIKPLCKQSALTADRSLSTEVQIPGGAVAFPDGIQHAPSIFRPPDRYLARK